MEVPHHYTRSGDSGAEYGLEAVIAWDGRGSENIRVIVSISGSGWSLFRRSSEDFIRASDGSFVDE